MKKLFAIALISTALSPMAAHGQEVENSVSANIESGRIFADQALVLYEDLTFTGEYAVSYDGWYASFWFAQTETRAADERDLCAGKTGDLAERTTYDANVCFFEIAGPEAYQLEFNVEYAITDELTLSGRVDMIRGGFETDVAYGGLAFARGPFDLNGGISGDTWSQDVVLQGGAGFTFPPILSLQLRASVKGFTVLDEGDPTRSDDEDGYVVGIGSNFTF